MDSSAHPTPHPAHRLGTTSLFSKEHELTGEQVIPGIALLVKVGKLITMLLNPLHEIYLRYTSLAQAASFDPTSGLGGKLLYCGEIDRDSRALLYAANIAGAASVAASADTAVLRQVMREGVIDFLVTSLEEALRILKNEVRKRETVSVGVSIAPEQLEAEMVTRGVLPDLLVEPPVRLFIDENKLFEKFTTQGSKVIGRLAKEQGGAQFVTWTVDRNFARWLPRLDQCARSIIPAEDALRQRWLRLAPRYLGRMAQREHGVSMSEIEALEFRTEAATAIRQSSTDSTEVIDLRIQAYPSAETES